MMNRAIVLAGAAMIGVLLFVGGAKAQGMPETVEIAKLDLQKLAAGYRASKVIGSNVVDDAGETIGKIDDLLVTPMASSPMPCRRLAASWAWARAWLSSLTTSRNSPVNR
jgi:hypothetical protein